jgi:hypothetical protein
MAVSMLLALPSLASAATIPVQTNADTSATDCTLRDAITAANDDAPAGACPAGAGSDTIDLSSRSGLLNVATQLPTISSTLTIAGPGEAAAPQLQVFAGDQTRIFQVTSGTVTVSGLSITRGGGTNCTAGCGMRVLGGNVTLDRVTVDSNEARSNAGQANVAEGGGIWIAQGATVVVRRGGVYGNTAVAHAGATGSAQGGGIVNFGSLTIDRSEVAGNQAVSQGADAAVSAGGGIANHGTLSVIASTFFSNQVGAVGEGSRSAAGGAIHNAPAAPQVRIDRSTFSLNVADGDAQSARAGALYSDGGGFRIRSATIAYNSAPMGADIVAVAPVDVANTIVALPQGGGASCAGQLESGGYNLESANSCGFDEVGDRPFTSPRFNPDGLQENGSTTMTLALEQSSPAIDNGKRAPGESVDQRGSVRPFDYAEFVNGPGGDGSDIGAYEAKFAIEPVMAPTITAGPGGDTGRIGGVLVTNADPAGFDFFSDYPDATFRCQLDTVFRPCESPVFYDSPMPAGDHLFTVQAFDQYGEPAGFTSVYFRSYRCTRSDAGLDLLFGTAGNDVLCGLAGDDTIYPGAGLDWVFAGTGNDAVGSSDGDDRIIGGPGNDQLAGGLGDDRFDGGPGDDVCNGGAGTDTATNCELLIGIP